MLFTPAGELVPVAMRAALRVRPVVSPRPLAEADRALADLAVDRVTGAAVLVP